MTPEDLDGLRYDVMTALGQLEPLHGLVAALVDTHQRGLGFLTPDARAAMGAQYVADRRYRTTQADREVVGLDWLNRDADVIPSGHVRAPGTVSAVSAAADIAFTLHELVQKTTWWLERREGTCVIGHVPAEPTPDQLILRLRALVLHVSSDRRLQHVWRETRRLVDDATHVVDGDDRAALDDPCPHCDRRTLVTHWRRDLIRCDRDRSGRYTPCRCSDPLCECRSRPVAYRHEWHRTPEAAGDRRRTWQALNNLLVARRAATTEQGAPTMTLSTTVHVAVRREGDVDVDQIADEIAATIKHAAGRMARSGIAVDPGTIKITPEEINAELRHLTITMKAAR